MNRRKWLNSVLVLLLLLGYLPAVTQAAPAPPPTQTEAQSAPTAATLPEASKVTAMSLAMPPTPPAPLETQSAPPVTVLPGLERMAPSASLTATQAISESAMITAMLDELRAEAARRFSAPRAPYAPQGEPVGPGTVNAVQVNGFRVYGVISTGGYSITVVLKTGTTVKGTATVWPANDLTYWVNLPVPIQPNDTVEVTAGGNTTVIPVTPLAATLDWQNDALDVSGLPAGATFTANLSQPAFGDYSTTTFADGAGAAHVTVFGDWGGNGVLTPDWQADAYGIVRYTQSTGHQVFRTLKSVTVYERGNRVDLAAVVANTPLTLTLQDSQHNVKLACPSSSYASGSAPVWFYAPEQHRPPRKNYRRAGRPPR